MGNNESLPKPIIRPEDMLKSDLRRTILAHNHVKSSLHTFDIIGCSEGFFRKWVNFQLEKNKDMNWNNYGTVWHLIPHRQKDRMYDFNDPIVRIKFFSWTNWFGIPVYQEFSENWYETKMKLIKEFLERERLVDNSALKTHPVISHGPKVREIKIRYIDEDKGRPIVPETSAKVILNDSEWTTMNIPDRSLLGNTSAKKYIVRSRTLSNIVE